MLEAGLEHDFVCVTKLASGGSSDIYKAYRISDGSCVIIKRFRSRQGMKRIRETAELMRDWSHPHLPRVYDCYEREGALYTVMEFIPGHNLKEVVRSGGPVPGEDVMKWAVQLSAALSYLHEHTPPVVHGDIKPSNIMLTPEGNVCLIDFHISLTLEGTRRRAAGYTKGYSPPEQYCSIYRYHLAAGIRGEEETPEQEETHTSPDPESGESSESLKGTPSSIESRLRGPFSDPQEDVIEQVIGLGIDERSDIYSLGASLYYLLRGKRPDANYRLIVPIDQCAVAINRDFTQILRKMMSPEPWRRYRNGTELYEALKCVAAK